MVTDIGGAQGRRGYRWANAYPLYTAFTTILPPNSRICGLVQNGMAATWRPAMLGTSSRHQGGAHIVMGDGAVKFISTNIAIGTLRRLGAMQDGWVLDTQLD